MSTSPVDSPLQAAEQSSVGRIAKSGLWSLLAHGIAAGSVLLVSVIIGRTLGPEDLGQYTYQLWILRVVPAVLSLGIPTALIRFVSEKEGQSQKEQAASVFRLVRRWHLIGGFLPAAFLLALARADRIDPDSAAILSAGIALLLLTMDHEALLVGLRRFRDLSLVAALVAVTQIAAAFLGVALDTDATGFVALYVLAASLGLLTMAVVAQRWLGSLQPEPLTRAETRRFLGFAGAVALAASAEAFLWGRPELIFLDRYRSDVELGFYSTALRLSSLASMIPLVAARALLPEFSYQQGAGRKDELQATYSRVCELLVLVTAPLALGGMIVAPALVVAVYGEPFAPAGTSAAILMAGSLVNALAAPSAAAVFIGPRPRLIAEVGVGAVALNAVLDVLIIPTYGPVGAAFVNVAVQTLSVLIGIAYAWWRLDLRYPLVPALKYLIAGAACAAVAAVVLPAFDGVLGLVAATAAGGAVYVVAAARLSHLGVADLRRVLKT